MFERFTPAAREIVVVALEEARMMRHARVGTEHLLVAAAAHPAIATLGLTRERARAEVVRTVGLGESYVEGQLPFTPAAQDALDASLHEAMRLGQERVEPGHVVLGLLRQRDGVALRVIAAAGGAPRDIRDAVIRELTQAPGAAVMVRLNEEAIGDLGNPRADARVLLAILERDGPIAAWLRERGVDEAVVRRMISDD